MDLIPVNTESFIKTNGLKSVRYFFQKNVCEKLCPKVLHPLLSYYLLKASNTSFLSLCSLVFIRTRNLDITQIVFFRITIQR